MSDEATEQNEARHRIKIDCTKEGIRLVDDLVRETGSASRAELFRRALNVLEWAVHVKQSGGRIAVEKDGDREYIQLWI